jgi:predicted nuclease with TOPRIM domain
MNIVELSNMVQAEYPEVDYLALRIRELGKPIQDELEAMTAELAAANKRVKELEAERSRLNYLLKFMRMDDVGDEVYVPGIVIRYEDLETELTARELIDRAIARTIPAPTPGEDKQQSEGDERDE